VTSSTFDTLPATGRVPSGTRRSAVARLRGLVSARLVERRERRELERAADLAGSVEWARMSGDFHRV
jgi:hypothetical protein